MEFVQNPDLNLNIEHVYVKEESIYIRDNEEDTKKTQEKISKIPQEITCFMNSQDSNSVPCKDTSILKKEYHEDKNICISNSVQNVDNCSSNGSKMAHNMSSSTDSSTSNNGNNEHVTSNKYDKFQVNISAIQSLSKDNQVR